MAKETRKYHEKEKERHETRASSSARRVEINRENLKNPSDSQRQSLRNQMDTLRQSGQNLLNNFDLRTGENANATANTTIFQEFFEN